MIDINNIAVRISSEPYLGDDIKVGDRVYLELDINKKGTVVTVTKEFAPIPGSKPRRYGNVPAGIIKWDHFDGPDLETTPFFWVRKYKRRPPLELKPIPPEE
jgi:hypothetical protein